MNRNNGFPWPGVDDRLQPEELENPYAAKAKAIGDVPAQAQAQPIMDADRPKAIEAPHKAAYPPPS